MEEGGYTSVVLLLPLPRGSTRHAAAYHPCQPSPPGNVAAFSATPSGVPAAPQLTAAGGGGGTGQVPTPEPGRAAGPPPPASFWTRGGAGAGAGVAGAPTLQPRELLNRRRLGSASLPLPLPPRRGDRRQHRPSGGSKAPPRPSIGLGAGTGRPSSPAPPSPACPPRPGGPQELGLDGRGQGMDTWVSLQLIPTAGPFGGKSSLLFWHTCPPPILFGARPWWRPARCPSGGQSGVEPLRISVCPYLFWWSRG